MTKTRPIEQVRSLITALITEIAPLLKRNRDNDIQLVRSKFKQAFSHFPIDRDVCQKPLEINGIPAQWFIPPQTIPQRTILYLHGGGYVFCSVATHQNLLSRLAKVTKARVLGLDYRLAPEHPFPAALEDAMIAYLGLLDQGVNPQDLAIAGDSAGAGLAIATLINLRDTDLPLPSAAVCLSPWLDLAGTGESMTTNQANDPFVSREFIRFLAQQYLGTLNRQYFLASPLYGDLQGLPPLLIQASSTETLRDDATRFAEKAKAAGVAVQLELWEEMVHVWHLFAEILPEAEQAIAQVGTFIQTHT